MSGTRGMTWISSFAKDSIEIVGNLVAGYLLDTPPGKARIEDVLAVAPDLSTLHGFGRMVPADERMPPVAMTFAHLDDGILDHYTALTGKVIYLIQDPRAMVSQAILMRRVRGEQRVQVAHKIISGIPGKAGAIWQGHVRDWTSPDRVRARFPGLADICVVRAEDLRSDPAGVLRRILEFLELPEPVDDARIERALADWPVEKVRESMLWHTPPGVGAFQEPLRPVDKAPTLPTLAEIGDEVEVAYRERLRNTPEFATFVQQFGY